MEDKYQHIKDKAMYLHSRRMHSVGEMRVKLLRSFSDQSHDIERVISLLLEKKILDDIYFARAFTRELVEYRGASIGKVRKKLYERHIAKELCEATIAEIDEENITKNLKADFEKAIESLRYKELDSYELREKLLQRLIRKGFSFEEVKALCHQELCKEE